MRIRLIIAALLALVLSARGGLAQQQTRLNTGWEFIGQDLGGPWEAVRPVVAGNPESVPLWQAVALPHCFNARDAVDPDVNYYQGPGWYRTQLTIQNPYQGGRTLLHFEGAGQKTEVYINMTRVGSHVGGYDEWTVDITQAVADFQKTDAFRQQFKGKVPLSVRCDNSRDLEMMPSDLSDFNLYGGLYRYLNLVYVPARSFERVLARAEVDQGGVRGRLTVRASLRAPVAGAEAEVSVRVADPQGRVVGRYQGKLMAKEGEQEIHAFQLRKPALWLPASPQLYTVTVSVQAGPDTYAQTEKVGFRHIEFVEHGPFRLNGQRLLLRGTHRHEDHAGVAAAMTEPLIRAEMLMMKEMGVNFIRLGHYQQSRIVLSLCDSLGIMVWEEVPWCRGGLGGPAYQAQGRRMLTNMIQQHFNHPAIIIWGLGNENDWPGDFPEFDKEKIRTFMKAQNDLAHQLDPARYTAIRRCDFCQDIPDVYSPSIWAGWYRGIYTDYKAATEKEFNGVKRFLHVEWGGDSHAGRHSETPDNALAKISRGQGTDERAGDASLFGGSARVSKDGDWSESYLCNLVDWHLKEQETMPWLSGTAYWPFKDFSTPVRPDNPVPYLNQKGVVERDFTKKEAYYVFQSYWTARPMARIYGHSWPVRWGEASERKMVKVYSNCDEAELFVNGTSCGVRKRDSQDFPAAGLRWLVALNEGANTLKVVARKGKEVVVDEISQQYQTEKWARPVKIILEKISEQDGIATVQVKLLDARGIPCLDAANWISYALAGDGLLLDNLGTSTGSRKVQAMNGRGRMCIKTNGGKSVLSVKSEGMPTAFITL